MKILFLLLCLSALLPAAAENIVSVYPETAGLPVSKEWKLSAGGKNVILYTTGTLSGKNASFGGFDFSGRAELVIHSARPVRSAVVRPLSLGIRPEITGNLIRFSVGKPCRLTVEINGSVESALHVFANPPEEDVPSPGDPNVVYFGPGLHEIATLELESRQTLYLAPGAIVRAGIPADEKNIESKTYCGFKGYKEMVSAVKKENVAVRGRGILDMSDLPWHSRRTLWFLDSRNILVEGITMLNSATWTIVAETAKMLRSATSSRSPARTPAPTASISCTAATWWSRIASCAMTTTRSASKRRGEANRPAISSYSAA